MKNFTITNLRDVFRHANLLSNGMCERDGYYIPVKDAMENDFEKNKKYFNSGDEFPDGEWVQVSYG